jgi:hypothetical protein
VKSSLRPTTIDDLTLVQQFLQRAFHSNPEAPFLKPAVLAWKYWESRDDWTEPRAYVLERDGAIIAHAGLWPVSFGAGTVRGIQMIDWASAKENPGAGLALLQRLNTMFDFVYSIGGSEMTCKILPTFGFVECARQWKAVRPLRPWPLIREHQQRSWRLAPRLARNIEWAMPSAAQRRMASGWTAEEIGGDEAGEEFYTRSPAKAYFSPRPAGFFRYLLRCPIMPVRLYQMRDGRGVQGHFVIGVLRGQARIGGVWLRDPDNASWQAALTLAQRAAAKLAGAYEIVAGGTEGTSEQAAVQSGFRVMGHTPIYLLNKKGKAALPRDFQFQLSDDDVFFFDSGAAEFWS